MTIVLETSSDPVDKVVRRPGVELRDNKHYHDVGPACAINPHPDPDRPHRRVTSLPGPGDWAPAARWHAGDYVRDNIATLATADLGEIRRMVAKGAEEVLDAAARRGTATHKYAEWRTKGEPIDYAYLTTSGADPWLAAVDNYLRDHPPGDQWCEVTCFDPEFGIAGTVDVVRWVDDDTIEIEDYKTRTSRHDKRASEAAQLGAYARAALYGYLVDDRGHRHRVKRVAAVSIVSFCPDGTYAKHELDAHVAIDAHEARMAVVEKVAWRTTHSEAFDIVATVNERLATLTDEQRNVAAMRWRDNDMPRVAELTLGHWALADKILTDVVPKPAPEAKRYPTTQECADVHDRIEALPEDLRAQVRRSGGGLRDPLSATINCDELEEWERLIVPAEARAARRPAQVALLMEPLDDAAEFAVVNAIFGPVSRWTSDDLDRCAELADAVIAGDLIVGDDGHLVVNPATVDGLPKRETTAAAKRIAAEIGRPKPAKFADVIADVVLMAAVRAA